MYSSHLNTLNSEGDIYSYFFVRIDQASASPVLETILERRLQRVRESGKGGRAVVRIRGVTDDVAAAFVRLLYAGRYRARFSVVPPLELLPVLFFAHAFLATLGKARV